MDQFMNPSVRRTLTLIAATAGTALLAGACAGPDGTDAAGGEEPVVRAETQAVVPADTASADASGEQASAEQLPTSESDAPNALVPGGWGPIQAGMSEEQLAGLGYTVMIDRPAMGNNLCSDGSIDVDGQPLFVRFFGDRLAGVSTSDPSGRTSNAGTAEGVSNGSPTADIPALYAGAEEVGTQVGIVHVVSDPADPGLAMSFTDSGGVITEIRAGDAAYVKYFESCMDFSGTGG